MRQIMSCFINRDNVNTAMRQRFPLFIKRKNDVKVTGRCKIFFPYFTLGFNYFAISYRQIFNRFDKNL